jgi:hypothetical protein
MSLLDWFRRKPPPPPPPCASQEDVARALAEIALPEGLLREAEKLRAIGRMEGPRHELVKIETLLKGLASNCDGGYLIGDPVALRFAFEDLARGAKELRGYNFGGTTFELERRPEVPPPPLAKAVVEAHRGSFKVQNGALIAVLRRMPDVEDRRVY